MVTAILVVGLFVVSMALHLSSRWARQRQADEITALWHALERVDDEFERVTEALVSHAAKLTRF